MAKFYFYTDLDKIGNQSPIDGNSGIVPAMSFGPVQDSNGQGGSFNSYQLTNLHLPNNDDIVLPPAAYAICTGQVFCVDVPCSNISYASDTDPDPSIRKPAELVNIILKPAEHLESENTLVKYYIYRSVLKKSLLSLANEVIPDSDPLSNKLSKKINAARTAGQIAANYKVTGNDCGLPFTVADNPILADPIYIEDIFLNCQVWDVQAGESLGYFPGKKTFSNQDGSLSSLRYFGMEIMLDNMGFNPLLSDVTQPMQRPAGDHFGNSNIKTFAAPSVSEKNNKEYVLNFMDPAAFYGNFYEALLCGSNDELRAWVGSQDTGLKADEIYNAILIGQNNVAINTNQGAESHRLFMTSNRIYIDIRNEFNFSLNFFNDYTSTSEGTRTDEDLMLKWGDEITDKKYVHSVTKGRNDYPILIFEKDDPHIKDETNSEIKEYKLTKTRDTDVLTPAILSESKIINWVLRRNKSETDKAHHDPQNKLYQRHNPLELKLYFYKNSPTAFYTAYVTGNVIQLDPSTDNKSKFKDINTDPGLSDNDPLKNYTDPIGINIYHYENNLNTSPNHDSVVNHSIAKYVKITVIKHESDPVLALASSETSLRSLEYLDNIFLPLDQIINFKVADNINYKVYEEAVYVNNMQVDGSDFMADIGIAKDATGNITLFANAHNYRNSQSNTIFEKTIIAKDGNNRIISGTITPASPGDTFLMGLKNLTDDITDKTDANGTRIKYETLTFVDDDNLNSITVENLTQNKEPVDYLSAPIKGFVSITITRADFETIKSKVAPDFLTNAKVFLAFQFIKYHPDATRYNKYEILLRGLKVDSGQLKIVDIPTGVYNYILYPSFTLNENAIGQEGKTWGYDIWDNPSTGLDQGPEQQIHSHIYFLRGLDLSNAEFKNAMDYFISDIRNVWNSQTNKGIEDAAFSISNTIIFPNDSIIHSDNVVPYVVTPYQLTKLKEKDIIVSVQRGNMRSSAYRRTIMLYLGDNAESTIDMINILRHTAAHEFGHIMGLGDRYCYMGVFYNGKERDPLNNNAEIPDSNNEDRILGKAGTGVALYIPPGVDDDYSTNYRWLYNLYSTLQEVPVSAANGPNCVLGEPAFQNFISLNQPTNGGITIFITPYQWQIVRDHLQEPPHEGDKFAFFKNAGYPTLISPVSVVFTGSFLGSLTNEDTGIQTIKTDDGFPKVSGVSYPNMDGRLVISSPGSLYNGMFSGDFIRAASDPKILRDFKTGGFETNKILKENNISYSPDLTGNEDLYQAATMGTGDSIAKNLWDSADNTITDENTKITYNNHPNRIAIAITIAQASGPR